MRWRGFGAIKRLLEEASFLSEQTEMGGKMGDILKTPPAISMT